MPQVFIGPRWEYINPQGVRFTARTAATIAILRLAASLPKSDQR